MPDIIPISNVRSILKDDKMAILTDPAQCLSLLRNYAGSVEAFITFFGVSRPEERQWIWFQARTTIKSDEALYKDWQETIQLNRDVRWDLMREEALQRLEDNRVGYVEKTDERKGTVTYIYKERDDLAYAKFVCGDELAGRIVDAKMRPSGPKGRVVEDDEDDDDEKDDAALRRAAGGA